MSSLPPPITGHDPDSFAHFTITTRLPHIIDRVIEDNGYPEEIREALRLLKKEIPHAPIRKLYLPDETEACYWNAYFEQYAGQNWLEAPFYFVEAYFYRRILLTTRFFEQGKWHLHDPFHKQKSAGLQDHTIFLQKSLEHQETVVQQQDSREENLRHLLLLNLWGNRADMSLLPEQQQYLKGEAQSDDALVIDDFDAFLYFLNHHPLKRIDFILDNAGIELAGDFLLADYFLSQGLASQIVFHAKAYPIFVSDATREDVEETVCFFKDQRYFQAIFGERIESYLNSGQLDIQTHAFWNAPSHFFEMPLDLQQELAGVELLISKGDANYRRLLGDAQWDFTMPIRSFVNYLPAPCLALRTLKSEIIAGLSPERLKEVADSDEAWLTQGKYGLVQFIAA